MSNKTLKYCGNRHSNHDIGVYLEVLNSVSHVFREAPSGEVIWRLSFHIGLSGRSIRAMKQITLLSEWEGEDLESSKSGYIAGCVFREHSTGEQDEQQTMAKC